MIGYKLTRSEAVAECVKTEIESGEGLSLDELSTLKIEPFEISQQEIDDMPEFPGW